MATHSPTAEAQVHGGAGTRAHGLTVSIVTPEGLAFEGPAASVVVPGHDGEVAFLAHHAPYVGALGHGELRVTPPGGAPRRWFLEGGVAEVAANAVTVLAERVLPVERIDVAKARADLAKAVADVAVTDAAREARDRAQASARARLRVAGSTGAAPTVH
jgi:F-type H+-transporting ATPase subunit epsilon